MIDRARSPEELARRAVEGDRDAVDALVRDLEGPVFAISLRMLWHREDAEDATQEILVRVITRLAQFDFRSRLRTWVFRVATNYLLDVKRSRVERERLTFTSFADDLVAGLSPDGPAEEERSMLVEEVKIGCTLAMLQCLDRPHRLAYILGEIMEIPGPEAADALELAPTAFRKRLQRAREAVETFTRAHCGLVSEDAACRCNRLVRAALSCGRIRADAPAFATAASSVAQARDMIRRLDDAVRVVSLHRSARPRAPDGYLVRKVVSALDGSAAGTVTG
ncbi:MAG: RNA polymerase sigma factor [Gemmatimonadetes bacterium]|nr:RNA polymerase sigma factor [Gemmatimonadota bacterium]